MPSSIDFYKGIFLHIIPFRIIVLVKHQKVSKYYENDYRSIYVVSMFIYYLFIYLFILDDSVDEEIFKFLNSKSSGSQSCLAFAWFFLPISAWRCACKSIANKHKEGKPLSLSLCD